MTDRYFDDLTLGEGWTGRPFEITEAEIVAFARQFDPQPMHLDPDSDQAKRFGGLIASGWHVASRVMRDFVDANLYGDVPLLGLGVNDLRWRLPVRPGDRLTVRREVLELVPSEKQPDRGRVRTVTEVSNQDGRIVLSFENWMQLMKRPKG